MIPANKGLKLPAEPLTPNEVKALINACSKRAVTGIRNRALIVVLYRAGLRVSEALALQPKDLDPIASTIRVLHGKGDIQMQLGHSSLATTDRYVRHLNPAAVVEAMKARCWKL